MVVAHQFHLPAVRVGVAGAGFDRQLLIRVPEEPLDVVLLRVVHRVPLELRVGGLRQLGVVDLVEERLHQHLDLVVAHLGEVELGVILLHLVLVVVVDPDPDDDAGEVAGLLVLIELLVEPLHPPRHVALVDQMELGPVDLEVVPRRVLPLHRPGPVLVISIVLRLLRRGERAQPADVLADALPVILFVRRVRVALERFPLDVKIVQLRLVGLRADVIRHHLVDRVPRRHRVRPSEIHRHLLVILRRLGALVLLDQVVRQLVDRPGRQVVLAVVGVRGHFLPRLHRLLQVPILLVALADVVERGAGVTDGVGKIIQNLGVALDRVEPLVVEFEAAGLAEQGVGRRLRLGELEEEGIVLRAAGDHLPRCARLVRLAEFNPLERVELLELLVAVSREPPRRLPASGPRRHGARTGQAPSNRAAAHRMTR